VRDAAKTDRCAGKLQRMRGIEVDRQTRCVHYPSAVDIVAIKMRCCGVYYACKDCHIALAGHAIAVWPRGEGRSGRFCAGLRAEMTDSEYLDCESPVPGLRGGFNPGCKGHWEFYFEE